MLVLSFDSTSLPNKINIGWLRKDVRVFVPNPLRCFKCQRFGHGSSTCRQSARCQRCGQPPHEGSECSTPKVCLSCGSSEHTVSSSQCPIWKEEKAVCELKAKSGLSYPEARRQVKASNTTPTPGKSYAQAARIQTASISTQTDPLAALPPLQVLKPLRAKPTTTSEAATESMLTDSEVSPSLSPSSSDPNPPPSASPVIAQRPGSDVQRPSRPYNKGPKTGRTRRETSPIPTPRECSDDRTSRPPIRISMGRNRASSWASPSRGAGPSHK